MDVGGVGYPIYYSLKVFSSHDQNLKYACYLLFAVIRNFRITVMFDSLQVIAQHKYFLYGRFNLSHILR